jgi:two-component system phosphate regulon sensor histidine kinase PhoR
MSTRAVSWVSLLSYGCAALFALLAILAFTGAFAVGDGWAFLLCGVAAALVGSRAVAVIRSESRLAQDERHRAELLQSRLTDQQTSVDSLADGLDVALMICDARGAILYANRRAQELFRFSNPSGKSVVMITLSFDLERLVVKAASGQGAQSEELSFSYPDERIAIAKAWTSGDDPNRVFLTLYDITELRRLERVRRDFVANVSHELRTPLTIIRNMAETLVEDDDPPQGPLGKRYLPQITAEVDRLSTISHDLLVLATAESNPVRKQSCDLAATLRRVISQLQDKAQEKSIGLTYEGPEECVIEANISQMSQVALNLIDNAINYTNQGFVRVSMRELDTEVQFEVADSGIGIASEHLPRIFERFYRIDRARSRSTGGTGLGLSIVKHIVEAHGGRVTVASALNEGSTFCVTLPVGTPPQDQADATA